MAENINVDGCTLHVDTVTTTHQFQLCRDGLFYAVATSPDDRVGNFKSIPVFNKLQCAELCTMHLQFSSIVGFDSRKLGYFLHIAVFFKSDNGAALSPQEF